MGCYIYWFLLAIAKPVFVHRNVTRLYCNKFQVFQVVSLALITITGLRFIITPPFNYVSPSFGHLSSFSCVMFSVGSMIRFLLNHKCSIEGTGISAGNIILSSILFKIFIGGSFMSWVWFGFLYNYIMISLIDCLLSSFLTHCCISSYFWWYYPS